ncbi:hypothetical protein [Parendozoicomonas sp. Alg238-R29]|uniref:hypothetical protein n=1 Tax=Parendozoicomonas sp. Alg238-R29 TaxID=2993446 RepID=UPI00248F0226|nr:hypothetical protein [Parendozoicomonas sp. Alg238-R29]
MGGRVLYHGDMLKASGGYSEYAVTSADILIAHPDVSPVTAAATPCAGWTAWCASNDKLRIASEDSLVISDATGGVGSSAEDFSKALEAGGIAPPVETVELDDIPEKMASLLEGHTIGKLVLDLN